MKEKTVPEVFPVTIDGEDIDLTEDNHTVALFRDTPEYDYLAIRPEGPAEELTEEQRTILVFRQQNLCHWLANLALTPEDQQALDEMKSEHGSFRNAYGWNSKVLLEDRANDFEEEFYIRGLTRDLDEAEGADDLLAG